jgi:hypothetical protein
MSRKSSYSSRIPHCELTLTEAIARYDYIGAVQLVEGGASVTGVDNALLQRLLCASCWMDSLTSVMRLLSCEGVLLNQGVTLTAEESALPQNKSNGWVALVDYVRSQPLYSPIDANGCVHPHHWISKDYDGMNAIMFAVMFAQADVVQALVDAGADASHWRTLALCVEANKPDALAILMAQPRAKENALSAVIQAAAMGNLECLQAT